MLPLVAFIDGSIDRNKASAFSVGSYAAAVVRSKWRVPEGPGPLVDRILVTTDYMSGREAVTNNRMEMSAFLLLTSARILFDEEIIDVFSDSKWTLGALFNPAWRVKKNRDLVTLAKRRIDSSGLVFRPHHVRAHAGCFLNELADYAALRSRVGRKAITIDVPFHPETHTQCLLCKNFPCEDGRRLNKKKWTWAFHYLKRYPYQICGRFVPYADVTWTGSPGPKEVSR